MILNEFGIQRNIKRLRKNLERSGRPDKDKLLAKLNATELSHIHKVGDETAGHITAGKGSYGTSDIVVKKDEDGNVTNVGSHKDVYSKTSRKRVKNHSGNSGFRRRRQLRPPSPKQIMNQRIALQRRQNNVSENHQIQDFDEWLFKKYS